MRDYNLYPCTCEGCVHRRALYDGIKACQYAIDTGKPKNCRASECTHYSTDKNDIISDEIFAAPLRRKGVEKYIEGRKRNGHETELQKHCENSETGISEN